MKAIVCTQYGTPDVLQLKEVEKPIPKEDEVLVKIHAASLNAADFETLRGDFIVRMTSPRRPMRKILGSDIAGHIEAVGINVKQFQPGDEVFGACNFGAFVEYRCVTEDKLVHKPANISFEEAATLPIAWITALHSLRNKKQIQPGDKVLINGASGGVGTFAVQIAKSFGAEVTGVCSTSKMDLVRSIGADHVIDYTTEDFTTSGRQYDLIFAIGGNLPVSAYRRALRPEGVYVCVGGSSAQYFQALLIGPLISMLGSKKLGVVFPMPNQKDLEFLAELIEAGKIAPVIDHCYPLSEVPEAIRHIESGGVQGKLVILVKHNHKLNK